MKLLRNFLRTIKYKVKFLGKINNNSFYLSNFKTDNRLTDLMNLYGSDKGGLNNHHNYSLYYSEIFSSRKDIVKNFLEVGLGTNNTNIPSNMGPNGKPLASLRAWKDYFQNAEIYGADIDRDILKNEERIRTYFVDQTSPISISEMFKNFNVDKFDIIIEDGLHEYKANICFFENAIDHLSDDGIYIIEDVFYKDIKKFEKYFSSTKYNFSIIELFHHKNIANNCIIKVTKNV
tara:strand:+ start:921 stop:1619 length:699 start_codon:yes stop_codon:yes gene_type:complete